jgi:hypothetical protein
MAQRRNPQNVPISFSTASGQTVFTNAGAAFAYVWQCNISGNGTTTLTFSNGAGVLATYNVGATSPFAPKADGAMPIFVIDPGASFSITQSGSVTCSGFVIWSN